MDWKEIGQKILSKVPEASDLAASFVPGGPLLSLGIKTICSLLGIKDESPRAISQALDDPKASDTVRLAMIAFNTEKLRFEYEEKDRARNDLIEELKINLQDVQNARQIDAEKTKATGKRDINLYVLAWVIMGGFIGLIICMLVLQYAFGKVLTNDPLLTMLLGSLSTDAGMVVGYFFGSSAGSAEKSKFMEKMQETKK